MPSPKQQARSSDPALGRSSTTGSTLRRGDLKISDPIPIPQVGQDSLGPQTSIDAANHSSSASLGRLDGTWPRKSTPPGSHVRTRSTGGSRQAEGPGFTSSDPTARISTGPSMLDDSLSSVPSKSSLSKPKNGGFRATIRRIFGSRRHREDSLNPRSVLHRSDPGHLVPPEKALSIKRTRLPSQPVSEITRASALGSHAPGSVTVNHFPQDYPLPASHNSGTSQRRRNTLPSVALSSQEAQMFAATLQDAGTSSANKAPVHVPTAQSVNDLRRRSRSADYLLAEARSNPISSIQWRRRSGEIQYWRTSVQENPVPAYVEPRPSVHYSSESVRTPVRSFAPSPRPPRKSHERESLRHFDFGPLVKMDNVPTTLEQRVTTLEVKLIDHEYAIAKLQGYDSEKAANFTRTPKRRSVQDLFQQPQPSSSSGPTEFHGRSFLSSPSETPVMSSNLESAPPRDRSSNAATIRPEPASQAVNPESLGYSPASSLLSRERFDTLMALLTTEQNARQALEEQVLLLQREVDELRSATVGIYGAHAYPTPSPESRQAPLPLRHKPARQPLAFAKPRVPSDETSRFSTTDAGDSDTDDGFLDVYETPRESHDYKSGSGGPSRASPSMIMI